MLLNLLSQSNEKLSFYKKHNEGTVFISEGIDRGE
jgi:hypothetical protein